MRASHLDPDLLQDLVRRYLCEDDESAIERLVQLTRAPLLAAASRVGRPTDAEDAVQVAYLSLTRRRGRDLDAPVFPWLLVATLRVAYRKKAKQQRQNDIAAALTHGGDFAVEAPEPGGEELAALVGAKIAALPQRYRDVLYLHYIAGLSHSDLARLLAAPIDTIRTRLHRGRALLRGRLSPHLRAALCFAPWWLIDHTPAIGSTTGGALMTKKTVSVTLLVLAALGAGGWVALSALNADDDEATQIENPAAQVSEEPSRGAGPTLVGLTRSAGDAAKLRETLGVVRAERDRLLAEVTRLKERAERWEPIAEIEQARRATNEKIAMVAARGTTSAQARQQASAKIDSDGDGTGEYAGFLELSGGPSDRIADGQVLSSPGISRAAGVLTRNGEFYQNGYLYRMFLPDDHGNGVGESTKGFVASQLDANLAESTWCMYAWPVVIGITGQRTFFVNQAGDVLATDDPRYSGSGNGPTADAAFQQPGITGPARGRGTDGAIWKQVN